MQKLNFIRMKLLFRLLFILLVISIVGVFAINYSIKHTSKRYIYNDVHKIPDTYTVLVLGALVSKSGYLSDFLQDRLDASIELYNNKKIKRFLLSGDHGQIDYDEVNAMKSYLLEKGIRTEDIFLDHAGFDTYNSMIRAKKIFQIDDVIIVTQKFHLPRSVYIARKLGLNAYGYIADKRIYNSHRRLTIREFLANIKAYIELTFSMKPKFLGDKIPITGDSKLSYDK